MAAIVATMAGCGSSSAGRTSADAVLKEADAFGGPHAKLYTSQAQIINADDGQTRSLPLLVAGKPSGDCEVIVNADLTHPGAFTHLSEYKKSAVPSWAWWAGGSALLLVLLLVAARLIRRTRTRRRPEPPEDDTTAA